MSNSWSLKVLIADDERTIADTLALILAKSGFETKAVYSGEAAVEMAETYRPDILITDVVMDGISGVEAAIQMRSLLPSCKILLFSGQASTVDLLEEARLKEHEFEIVSKPLHPDDLLARLRASIAA